jgi:alkylation response protein AidB-like acyl-CoA dehydrogenase
VRGHRGGCADHWHEEVRLEDGRVVVPPYIAAGHEKLRQAGLVCLTLSPDYGGYGLPAVVNSAYLEMVARADPSLMTIIGLQSGVAADIEKYGTDELRQRYLPRFATGELQGAMDLTEPQAGSDLGGILARATQEGGRCFIDGEKIFITNGGAPIHLVLAREASTFEQSKGTTNGLNLMLCPVSLPDGTPNRVRVSRVEQKMGIHGSPTCVVEFDHAEAFLLGKVGQGFRAMLDLMNNARLGVAAQAVGVAEAACRAARAHAEQRVQFGAPIIEQPLVKSMLTLMVINIAAARALLYRTCALSDMTEALRRYLATERGAADPERAKLQEEFEHDSQLIRFFTPLCKYYATEISDHVTRQGIQIHGGIGFMAETPAAHYHADSIITTIYEGTSEIQASFALKEMGKGALFATLGQTRSELEALRERHPEMVDRLCDGIGYITDSAPALMGDPQYALLNAKRMSEMVIDVVAGAELAFQADLADGKLELAQSFIRRHMLSVELNMRRIASGDATRLKRYDRILGLGAAAS